MLACFSITACKHKQESSPNLLLNRSTPQPTCIPGSQISYRNTSDPNGGSAGHGTTAPGRQHFEYNAAMTGVELTSQPSNNGSVIFYRPSSTAGSTSWIWGDDWCYNTATNSISFLRNPIRDTMIGPAPGKEIGDGYILWVGYQLPGTINVWDLGQQEGFRDSTVQVTYESGKIPLIGRFVPGPDNRKITIFIKDGRRVIMFVSNIVKIESSEGTIIFSRIQ